MKMIEAVVSNKYTPAKSKHKREFVDHLDHRIPYTPAAVKTQYN
jgi:hypothetical protein